MRNRTTILLFFLTLILFSSCRSLIYKAILPKEVKTFKFENEEGREVVIFEMFHIAKPEYFESVAQKVKDLRADGYVIYFESVEFGKQHDSLTKDTLKRKMRWLLGHDFVQDYTVEANSSLPKFYSNKKYEMQSVENTGLDLKKDKLVDLRVEEIIQKYEDKYNEIPLNQCDWDTDFGQKYDCRDDKMVDSFYALNTIREEYVANYVANSEDKKIALLYGRSHHYFIRADLKNLAGFTIVDD